MKAREMGRFLAEFLEGFTGDVSRETPAPAVVPVEAIKEAVASFLQPILDAEAEQPADPARKAQQLDLLFADAGGSEDPIAEATLRRVHEAQERAARQQAEQRNGQAVPEMYDPNDPGSTKPWTVPVAER